MQINCSYKDNIYFRNSVAVIMKNKYLDWLGMAAAGLCLIHCLVFPFWVLLSSLVPHNHYVDLAFLLIGAWPVINILLKDGPKNIKILLATSLALVATAVAIEFLLHIHSVLIYFGAIGLIGGHLGHWKTGRTQIAR